MIQQIRSIGVNNLQRLIRQGCHVSGKCQEKKPIFSRSGNFVMSCEEIVREFCHDIISRLLLPSYDKGSTWVVFHINVCLANINPRSTDYYVKLLPFKNPGFVGELLLITVKSFFYRMKNKRNSQGILNGLKCGNPVRVFTSSKVSLNFSGLCTE